MTGMAWRGRVGRALAAVAVSASLLGIAALPVWAQGPEEATTLTSAADRGGTLPGSSAGSFAYFRVPYPGGEEDAAIEVRFSEKDPALIGVLGFNVYGPDGLEGTGAYDDDSAALRVEYSEDDAADLLVQIYNYGSQTVSYSVSAEGVPEPADSAAAGEVTTTPEVTQAADEGGAQEADAASGVVVGTRAGAFATYIIAYPGDESDVTVTMWLSPEDPSFSNAFGFQIYNPSGERVAVGQSTDTLSIREAEFASDTAGDYTVQVFNYSDGVPLTYSLSVTE